MSTLATKIINNTFRSVLNWDHEINPTSVEDFLSNVEHIVRRFTGYTEVTASIVEQRVLVVECAHRLDNYRLLYDVRMRRDINGRAAHIGLGPVLNDICRFISELDTN